MKYDPATTVPICELCMGAENTTKVCPKCGVDFCVHFASTNDIQYCSNCLSDFKVVETIETKVTERVNAEGIVVARQKQIAKNIRLVGMDWLFMAKKISAMTDEEVLYSIEYHSAIKSLLISEREERRVEHFQKMKGVKLTPTIDSSAIATNGVASNSKKRVKIDKKPPNANDVAAALGTILKAKIDPAALAAALANLKK